MVIVYVLYVQYKKIPVFSWWSNKSNTTFKYITWIMRRKHVFLLRNF
jgi:hypothetical protein